jgi:hypothetical protein
MNNIIKPFEQTHLGRLPIEMLGIVTRFLDDYNLAAVALIGPKLRGLAERRLYADITVPFVVDGDYEHQDGNEL